MQINALRCHPKLTADHYETARGEKQNFLSRLIEQNNIDVLHLCFIGFFYDNGTIKIIKETRNTLGLQLKLIRREYNDWQIIWDCMAIKFWLYWCHNDSFPWNSSFLLESVGEHLEKPKVALGCASSNSYASLELSKLPERIHNSIYTS